MRIWVFLLMSCLIFQASAKEYDVETGRDDIICKLQTLSPDDMKDLVGDFKTKDYDVTQKYTAINIKIENKSPHSIYLPRNNTYLKEIKDIYVSKDQFIKNFYDPLEEKLLTKIYGLAAVATLTSILSYVSMAGFLIYNSLSNQSYNKLKYAALGTAIASAPIGFFTGIEENSSGKSLEKIREHIKNLYDKNQLQLLQDTLIYYYSEPREIPPQAEFHDVFFIRQNNATDDPFEASRTLLYSLPSGPTS